MIILTKEILENDEAFYDTIKNEKALINSTFENQIELKNILLDYMQKLVDCTYSIDIKYADIIIELLNNFKKSLELFNINMELLNNLLNLTDNITSEIDNINFFNKTFLETNECIFRNTLQIEKVLPSILPYLTFTFNDIHSLPTTNVNVNSTKTVLEKPVNNDLSEDVSTLEIIENTLIISETKGKVFLPYTSSLLNDILINNSDKYSSIEDVILKNFTLSFDLFKNPAVARFREAFKLVRKKENHSIKEAFDLGMELLFNYNLHPAIISACKNLDELDIYLDYLEDNETHKFDCFKIVFEVNPVVVKSKKS